MKIRLLALGLIFLLQHEVSGQIVVRPPSQDEQKENNSEGSGPSRFLKNSVGLDLSWLVRGNVLLGYERVLGDLFSIRATCGLSFGDFLDGVLYEDFKSMNESSLRSIQADNTLSYGLELRYHPTETGYFDSGYIGGGLMLRNYNYTGIYDQSKIDSFLPPSNINVSSRSSIIDLYVRYGGQVRLNKSKSSVLFLEYGLILGYSFGAYDQITVDYLNPNNPNAGTRPLKVKENSASYLILPVLSLGYGF